MAKFFQTTQTFAGILADWDPDLRVSTFYVEVLVDQDPNIQITQHFIEYLADQDPLVRVTQYHLEVLYSLEGIAIMAPEQSPIDLFPVYIPVEYGERWGHNE
jgi:hypothetical protein